jgi:hypothetical protein
MEGASPKWSKAATKQGASGDGAGDSQTGTPGDQQQAVTEKLHADTTPPKETNNGQGKPTGGPAEKTEQDRCAALLSCLAQKPNKRHPSVKPYDSWRYSLTPGPWRPLFSSGCRSGELRFILCSKMNSYSHLFFDYNMSANIDDRLRIRPHALCDFQALTFRQPDVIR